MIPRASDCPASAAGVTIGIAGAAAPSMTALNTSPLRSALDRYLERHGERAAETAWLASLAMVERAAQDAREGQWGRWQFYPRGELRRLRGEIAAALELARLAAYSQQAVNDRERALDLAATLQARAAEKRPRSDGETRQRVRSRLATLAAQQRLGRKLEPWETAAPGDFAAADRRITELARERLER